MAKKKAAPQRGYATTSTTSNSQKNIAQSKKSKDSLDDINKTISNPSSNQNGKKAQSKEIVDEDPETKAKINEVFLSPLDMDFFFQQSFAPEPAWITPDLKNNLPQFSLTSSSEHLIIGCLKKLHMLDIVDGSAVVLKDRNLKRLNAVFDAVKSLGFSEEQITQAMLHTGGFPLRNVLDWLCVNLPFEELPKGYADKLYFSTDELEKSKVKLINYQNFSRGSKNDIDAVAETEDEDPQIYRKNAIELSNETKAWIAKYVDQESDEENESSMETTEGGAGISDSDTAKQSERSKKKKSKSKSSFDIDELSDDEGGLLGAFESAAKRTAPKTKPSTTVKVVDLTLPASWTGKTPKVLLLEQERRKLPKQHRNSRLGINFYRSNSNSSGVCQAGVNNKGSPIDAPVWDYKMPPGVFCKTMQEAENYAATIALFNQSASSVVMMLPQCFRDIWNDLKDSKNELKETENKNAKLERVNFLESVMVVDGSSIDFANTIDDTFVSKKTDAFKHNSSNENLNNQIKKQFKSRLDKKFYLKYLDQRKQLPAYQQRDSIINIIRNHQVILIAGETGSGKSTQVPQFILEDWLLSSNSSHCNIVCTQPRRISALSLSERVSLELGDEKGEAGSKGAICGYQIRMESNVSATTRLTYCTAGILLRRLESDTELNGLTHVIIDEAHERTMESDFLIYILKQIIQKRKDLKIIIMSATMNAEVFQTYFEGCAFVEIPGRTFPVKTAYLEDIIQKINYLLCSDSEYSLQPVNVAADMRRLTISGKNGKQEVVEVDMNISSEELPTSDVMESCINELRTRNDFSSAAIETLRWYNEEIINFDLIEHLIYLLCFDPAFQDNDTGAIVVFMPGIGEIRQLYDRLDARIEFKKSEDRFRILPLHSSLTSAEQALVFEIPPEGVRKIVISTNIAETGVTIPDCTVVIDTGRVKEMRFEHKNRMSALKEVFVAQANAKQRRGRAGRVKPGRCFHMFTKYRFENAMPAQTTPEILRLPLEELCLKIKLYKLPGKVFDVLSQLITVPESKFVEDALQRLVSVSALTEEEELTALGMHLASFPVDIHIGKMLVFGVIFKCLEPILTIAACLSYRSPFVRPFGKEAEADAQKLRFRVWNSDFLTYVRAYDQYMSIAQKSQSEAYAFCKKNFLSVITLRTVSELKQQFCEHLSSSGFIPSPNHLNAYNRNARDPAIVHAVIIAGLYPNVAFHDPRNNMTAILPPTTKKKMKPNGVSVKVHPSSMLDTVRIQRRNAWVMYHTLLELKRVYVTECHLAFSLPLLLFGGPLYIHHHKNLVSLNNHLLFKCYPKTVTLLKRLRTELDVLLRKKLYSSHSKDQKTGVVEKEHPIIELTERILQMEYEKERAQFETK